MNTQNNSTLNENTIRITAFLAATLALVYLLSGNIIPFILLAVDFATRGFGYKQYSLLRFIADKLNDSLFNRNKKPIFAPPKLFAAKIGLLFCAAVLSFHFIGWHNISFILAGVLTFFALLESLANVCVACYMYSFMHKTGLIKS